MKTFGQKKLSEILELLTQSKITTENSRQIVRLIIDGDERMPIEIAKSLGLIGE
jgi:Asp-tRNA(Asn)/Glu-tRNA(Gln) amidotransferase B subunit